jgi:hypothetical protein
VSQYAPLVNANALSPAISSKLKTETALANPRLSDHTDNSTIAPHRICKFEFERSELLAAPDKGS